MYRRKTTGEAEVLMPDVLPGGFKGRGRRSPWKAYAAAGVGAAVLLLVIYALMGGFSSPRRPELSNVQLPVAGEAPQAAPSYLSNVVSEGSVLLPPAHPGEEYFMYYLAGGSGKPEFFLTHSKDSSATETWGLQIEDFGAAGSFHMVDMINSGKSNPGASNPKRFVTVSEHGSYYAHVIKHFTKNKFTRELVLGCKGTGCGITIAAAKEVAHNLKGIFMVAPDFSGFDWEEAERAVLYTPTLIMWADDDAVVPVTRLPTTQAHFHKPTVHIFNDVAPAGVSRRAAHNLERMRPKEFWSVLETWLEDL